MIIINYGDGNHIMLRYNAWSKVLSPIFRARIYLSVVAAFDVVTASAFRFMRLSFFDIVKLVFRWCISAIIGFRSFRRRNKRPIN